VLERSAPITDFGDISGTAFGQGPFGRWPPRNWPKLALFQGRGIFTPADRKTSGYWLGKRTFPARVYQIQRTATPKNSDGETALNIGGAAHLLIRGFWFPRL